MGTIPTSTNPATTSPLDVYRGRTPRAEIEEHRRAWISHEHRAAALHGYLV